jgi:hypothetical protein
MGGQPKADESAHQIYTLRLGEKEMQWVQDMTLIDPAKWLDGKVAAWFLLAAAGGLAIYQAFLMVKAWEFDITGIPNPFGDGTTDLFSKAVGFLGGASETFRELF